jgi:peptidoglycan/LPS O-acetylase OafA/YrhL
MTANTFHSGIIADARLLSGLLGLRGAAALCIVLFHVDRLTGISPPGFLAFIGKEFAYSVHLFFVLSAFSLMYSTGSTIVRPTWIQEYFIKRFFRIAPLFYVMIIHELLRQYLSGGAVATPATHIIANLTFTFNFFPFAGMVWAGWTIGVEMLFYAIFPVLLITTRKPATLLVVLLVAFAASTSGRLIIHAAHQGAPSMYRWDWSYFAFISNLWFFVLGMAAFRLAQNTRARSVAQLPIAGVFIAVALAWMVVGGGEGLKDAARLDLAVYGVLFAALCVRQYARPTVVFANSVLEFLGERSFSLYLLHPVVIFYLKPILLSLDQWLRPAMGGWVFFVCAGVVLSTLLPAAEIAYRYIERPSIATGRKFVGRVRAAGLLADDLPQKGLTDQ